VCQSLSADTPKDPQENRLSCRYYSSFRTGAREILAGQLMNPRNLPITQGNRRCSNVNCLKVLVPMETATLKPFALRPLQQAQEINQRRRLEGLIRL
jgi:hypothetical protein